MAWQAPGYLCCQAHLLLDGATIAVKVPVGAGHHSLACCLIILHHTLYTPGKASNANTRYTDGTVTETGMHKRRFPKFGAFMVQEQYATCQKQEARCSTW